MSSLGFIKQMAKNSFFRFKQFTIQQDQCAMKVCTDACVFGAWADVGESKRILDIGTGTGLLALMVAQRNPAVSIDAVELNQGAYEQAVENASTSAFKDQIHIFQTAIQDFDPGFRYDCVISNPPFFQSDLRSPDETVNQAHHADTLTFQDLIDAMNRLVSPSGKFHLLLPVDESVVFSKMAGSEGWFVNKKMTLYHQKGKNPFRQLTTYAKMEVVENGQINEDLYLYEPDGKTYHPEFRELMKDYYLIF